MTREISAHTAMTRNRFDRVYIVMHTQYSGRSLQILSASSWKEIEWRQKRQVLRKWPLTTTEDTAMTNQSEETLSPCSRRAAKKARQKIERESSKPIPVTPEKSLTATPGESNPEGHEAPAATDKSAKRKGAEEMKVLDKGKDRTAPAGAGERDSALACRQIFS